MQPKPLLLDFGICASLAARLGEDVEIAYSNAEYSAFPVSRDTAVASGLKNVEIVEDPIRFMLAGKASHVIIPDLHLTDFAKLARELKIPLFASGAAEELENDRWKLLEFLEANDLPVIQSSEIVGIDALGKYLQNNDDKYIKISTFRGDLETEHHFDWERSQADWFLPLKERLGPVGATARFIVQDPIDSEIEIGIDTLFRNGAFATPSILGVEKKDAAYVGKVMSAPPSIFKPTLDAFQKYLTQKSYRNFWTCETRIMKDGTVYFTDATHRMPWPPSGVMMAAATNFTDVILKDAEPDYGEAKYLCELILCSDAITSAWVRVDYPKELRRNYAFHRFCVVDGKTWVIPHSSGFKQFGSALGWGSTIEGAKEMCVDAAEQISGYLVKYEEGDLDKAQADLTKFLG